ncbi:helix-turn-helix domain-containing protein [Nocardia sp. NBC_01503]|uniref:helix-turn-helix domain-containing protein n=1 Tax=Nocardia sp. NBC_01503 TaxID=2975997 RepID=UPI002E7B201D|nr:helix-turn-helix domain-containing protein [Nocardia sp. NBC_01503]WTL32909.1 helix-turn-helix domain-containing protein [Nocardia sp. NBC_01503]
MPAGKTRTADSSPPTQRVISIVELLAAQPTPLTSAEIADSLDLNRSTVGSILAALAERAWVRRLPDLTYRLGPALAALGVRMADTRGDRAWLNEELERLAEHVDCGAALTVIDGEYLEFVAVTRDRLTVGIKSGVRIPLRAPAGAGIIAHSGPGRQQDWLETRGPERRDEYREVLSTVRATGYCAWRLEPDSLPTARVLSDVADHLAEHPAGKDLRGRVLSQLATIVGSAYDQATLDQDIPLPLSYVSAPVFDSTGHAVMELQIGPLRMDVTRPERRRYLAELAASARRLGDGIERKHHARP